MLVLEVDCAWFLIEEVGHLDDFREVAAETGPEFLAGDEVEHVGHVGEDDRSMWKVPFVLGPCNVLLDGKLGCFDEEVLAIGREVVGKKMEGKTLMV